MFSTYLAITSAVPALGAVFGTVALQGSGSTLVFDSDQASPVPITIATFLGINATIASLTATAANHTSTLASVSSSLSTASSTVSSHTSTLSSHTSTLSALQTQINAVAANVSAVQTPSFNSNIMTSSVYQQFVSWGKTPGTRLYSMTANGAAISTWHSLVDNKGPTLVIGKASNGYIFGGYISASWSAGCYYNDANAFLFNVVPLAVRMYPCGNGAGNSASNCACGSCMGNAICAQPSYGPTWGGGHDMTFGPGQTNMGTGMYCYPGHTYSQLSGHNYPTDSGNYICGTTSPTLTDMETWTTS